MRALPSAKTRLSETPVPVTAAFQMAPGDVNGDVEPSLTPEKALDIIKNVKRGDLWQR